MKEFTKRTDFTYILGAYTSLILLIISVFFYKSSSLPMIVSLVSFFTYLSVITRGIVDPKSWGNTKQKINMSIIVGYTSIFVITAIIIGLILYKCLNLPTKTTNYIAISSLTVLTLTYAILFKVGTKIINDDNN